LLSTISTPCEIIVNCDGGSEVEALAFGFLLRGEISKVIMSAGGNRGVGHSFQNCFRLAEGDIIMKTDTDLIFQKGWDKEVTRILAYENVGAVSLFNYRNYDPKDERFNILRTENNYHIVDDFVSSVFAFKKERLKLDTPIKDDGMHSIIQAQGTELAITIDDYIKNTGFGIGKSVYVEEGKDGPQKVKIHEKPHIFQ
jgi:hypothetical protein